VDRGSGGREGRPCSLKESLAKMSMRSILEVAIIFEQKNERITNMSLLLDTYERYTNRFEAS
jgi:hypothetical protein